MLLFHRFSWTFYSNVAVLLDCKDSKLNSSASNLFAATQNCHQNFSLIVSTADEAEKADNLLSKMVQFYQEKLEKNCNGLWKWNSRRISRFHKTYHLVIY